MTLLKLTSTEIGQVGGGRNRQSGIVDLGMLQSLDKFEPADLEDFFNKYGFVVVDECHHLPAITFETSMKKCAARYILGLTATPKRNDQLDDIIPMQCGPIRFRMVTEDNGIPRYLIVRDTALQPPAAELNIQAVFKAMSENEGRNRLIQDDIALALEEGRRCIVLSRFKAHCKALANALTQRGKAPYLLTGDLGKKERTAIISQIQSMPPNKDLLIVATSQYLGEGFDCPQVDTLFLAFPVKFRGKLIQQVGRILRSHEGKTNARVYDYVDKQVPILNQMYYERAKAYKSMRFTPNGNT
jgi:superfamily II DNA or RNA helicase